jgi:hypothetical protein
MLSGGIKLASMLIAKKNGLRLAPAQPDPFRTGDGFSILILNGPIVGLLLIGLV